MKSIVWHCPECQAPLTVQVRHCPSCGARLGLRLWRHAHVSSPTEYADTSPALVPLGPQAAESIEPWRLEAEDIEAVLAPAAGAGSALPMPFADASAAPTTADAAPGVAAPAAVQPTAHPPMHPSMHPPTHLPALPANAAERAQARLAAKAATRAAVRRHQGAAAAASAVNADVLIAAPDDEERQQVCDLLERFGFRTLRVDDADQAHAMAKGQPLAAAFVRVTLDDDGDEGLLACRALKAALAAHGPSATVLMLPAAAPAREHVRARLAGCDGIMTLPTTRGALARALEACRVPLPNDARRGAAARPPTLPAP